jgi:hypothetical protein
MTESLAPARLLFFCFHRKDSKMQNQKQPKLFAFKLAEQQNKDAKPAQTWKVRDGVALAGCTVLDEEGAPYRYSSPRLGSDAGDYC